MAGSNTQQAGSGSKPPAGFDPLTERANTLRIATPNDLSFVLALQKRFSNQIGFIPKAGLDWYVEHGHVLLCIENAEPAGYLLGRPSLRFNRAITPITQAAVAMDAQRRKHGLALLRVIEHAARTRGQLALQANCRSDLEANAFWKFAGFEAIGTLEGTTARNVARLCWRKALTTAVPSWFWTLPPVAGFRAARTNAQPTFATLFNERK